MAGAAASGVGVPAACTTAAAVRTVVLEPAMELTAIGRRERELLLELAQLMRRRQELAGQITSFVDHAAQRLDHAERAGSYEVVPPVVSETPNMRHIARRINAAIDVLSDSGRAQRDHDVAREALHAIFETFGDGLFRRAALYHVGQARTLTLRGEFDRWRA